MTAWAGLSLRPLKPPSVARGTQGFEAGMIVGTQWFLLGGRVLREGQHSSEFSHVNLRPTALEVNLVHQLVDQINSPTVLGVNVLSKSRIGN